MPVVASSTEFRDRPASSGLLRSWGRTLSDKDSNATTENNSTVGYSTPAGSLSGPAATPTGAGQPSLVLARTASGMHDSSKEVGVVKELASAKASLEGHRQPLTAVTSVGSAVATSSHRLADVDRESRELYGENNILPPKARRRLYELFGSIEKEFENLCVENVALRDKVEMLSEQLLMERGGPLSGPASSADRHLRSLQQLAQDSVETVDGQTQSTKGSSNSKTKQGGGSHLSQKIKTTYKLKASTSRIVSSFKTSALTCAPIACYSGHRDGVWEVSAPPNSTVPVVATASADHTARLWDAESGVCVLQYSGHSGSVNSVRFHPSQQLMLTASGDKTVHIWRTNPLASVAVFELQPKGQSSEDEVDSGERDENDAGLAEASVLRVPVLQLTGHQGAVVAADWLINSDQVITASWDRIANVYDVNTGELVTQLIGHDLELTNLAAHPSQRLVVTSSKDTTFRLWDFREAIHSVSVFQGHTESVSSVAFTAAGDRVVSGSDDRTVKVWELRNMRSPLSAVRLDSPVNRLSLSSSNVIAIPHDNRHVRLYDLNGQRLARLPRNNRIGHRRMVCATAWLPEDCKSKVNLVTCGFDKMCIGWSVTPSKEPKESKDKDKDKEGSLIKNKDRE